MLTLSSLEKRLRFILSTTKVIWRAPTKDTWAYMQSQQGSPTICLPPKHDDYYTLQLLLHELCHFALPGELGAFGSLEEDILGRVLEPRLMEHIYDHRGKQRWWLAQLQALRNPND